jgi:hypothetical protein
VQVVGADDARQQRGPISQGASLRGRAAALFRAGAHRQQRPRTVIASAPLIEPDHWRGRTQQPAHRAATKAPTSDMSVGTLVLCSSTPTCSAAGRPRRCKQIPDRTRLRKPRAFPFGSGCS